jgi:hypothetical protein
MVGACGKGHGDHGEANENNLEHAILRPHGCLYRGIDNIRAGWIGIGSGKMWPVRFGVWIRAWRLGVRTLHIHSFK